MAHTVSENLQTLVDARVELAANLTTKGAPSDASESYPALAARVLDVPTEGGPKPHEARFFDIGARSDDEAHYGALIASKKYATGEDISLPTPPTRDGLVFNGWTHTANELQNCQYRPSERGETFMPGHEDVGATYKTSDGRTHIWIQITDGVSKIISLLLSKVSFNAWVNIDWGDGDDERYQLTTSSVSRTHTFATIGVYHIQVWTDENVEYGLGNGATGAQIITGTGGTLVTKVYISEFAFIKSHAFNGFRGMSEVSLPPASNILSSDSMFLNCSELLHLSVPHGLTSLGKSFAENCTQLFSVCLPPTISDLGDRGFFLTPVLERLVLPRGINSLPNNFFDNGSAEEVVSDTLSTFGAQPFNSCYLMKHVNIAKSITVPGASTFVNAFNLELTDLEINVLTGATSVVSWLQKLKGTLRIYSTNGVSALAQMINFNSVHRLVIGANFTSITGAITTQSCMEYVFEGTVPPTLANATNISAMNKLAMIYVPDESVNAYKTATNWTGMASYIYPMSELPA